VSTTLPTATPIKTRIGDLHFTHDFTDGYPTPETVEKLYGCPFLFRLTPIPLAFIVLSNVFLS